MVLGVVAASHLNARGGQRVGRKVQHGRGDRAHVNDVDTTGRQAAHQRSGQRWPAQAAISPDGHRFLTCSQRPAAKCLAQPKRHGFVDGGRHHAANVISLEDGCVELHDVSLMCWGGCWAISIVGCQQLGEVSENGQLKKLTRLRSRL